MNKKILVATCVGSALLPFLATAVILPPPVSFPTHKDDCKKGGWENYNGMFKNQGDCVSFVATNGKNQPNGSN